MNEYTMDQHLCEKISAAGNQPRLHYMQTAYELETLNLWQQYLAELSCELFGLDYEIGDAFLKIDNIKSRETLLIIKDMTASGKFEPRKCEAHPFNLLSGEKAAVIAKRIWRAQTKVCLPLLEIERSSFINAQYGKLLGVIGADYWDEKAKDYKYLWNHELDRQMENPFELPLSELSKLPYRVKQLVMLNTYSYPPFYRMDVNDRDRLVFAADLWDRLSHNKICSCSELGKLFEEHDSFLRR